jgi:hypothetical protein
VLQAAGGCAYAAFTNTGALAVYHTPNASAGGGPQLKWASSAAPPSSSSSELELKLKLYSDGQLMTITPDASEVLWSNNVSRPGAGPFTLGLACNASGFAALVETDGAGRVVWDSASASAAAAASDIAQQLLRQQYTPQMLPTRVSLPLLGPSSNSALPPAAPAPPAPPQLKTIPPAPTNTTAQLLPSSYVTGLLALREWLLAPPGALKIPLYDMGSGNQGPLPSQAAAGPAGSTPGSLGPAAPDPGVTTTVTSSSSGSPPSASPQLDPSRAAARPSPPPAKQQATPSEAPPPALGAPLVWPTEYVPPAPFPHDVVYISNGGLRAGFDRAMSGALSFLSSSSDANLINNWDVGRLVQQSYYGNPDGSVWALNGGTPVRFWGWHSWAALDWGRAM